MFAPSIPDKVAQENVKDIACFMSLRFFCHLKLSVEQNLNDAGIACSTNVVLISKKIFFRISKEGLQLTL